MHIALAPSKVNVSQNIVSKLGAMANAYNSRSSRPDWAT